VIYLSKEGTVHATDSLIVDQLKNPVPASSGKAKIVALPDLQGAMSWFGTAALGQDWKATDWLITEAAKYKGKPPDEFAGLLAADLTDLFWKKTGSVLPKLGMGIHLTFYETVDGNQIPELIWITNFNTITALGSYKPEHGPGFVAQRQTFHTITKQTDFENHAKDAYRGIVADYLNLISPLYYQNGDILLTDPSATLTEQMIVNLMCRKELSTTDPLRIFGKRALYRAEIAALTQKVFSAANKIGVGTPCFNIIIPPTGAIITDTPTIPGML
jgi:hypothetical protein